jgi:hypothetical protein
MAWVIADGVANNGIYKKTGGSGTGSWSRVGDLPYNFIRAFDAGAGTAAAIVATSELPVGNDKLVVFIVNETNTGPPTTISFNGGAALTIITASGSNVAPGSLIAGMAVIGFVQNPFFRLLTDQASAAIQAAAEDAQAAAEAARDLAIEAADQAAVEGAGDVPMMPSRAFAIAATIPVARTYVQVQGYATHGDGGAALYKKVVSEPTHAGKFQSADGAWWELAELSIVPQMLGAKADGIADDTVALQAAINVGSAQNKPVKLTFGIHRLTTTISLPQYARIAGSGMPIIWSSAGNNPTVEQGTWVHLDHAGVGFVADDAAITFPNGFRNISDFGTFRNQPEPDGTPFTPSSFSWDFYFNACNDVFVDSITLLNPSLGIICTTSNNHPTGRIHFHRIYGQPLTVGIRIDYCYDVARLDFIHFHPIWRQSAEVYDYTLAHGNGIQLGRVDLPQIDRIFTYAYQMGIFIFQSPNNGILPGGTCGNFQMGSVACDYGGAAIYIQLGANGCLGHINSLIGYGATTASVPPSMPCGITILSDSCDIRIGSLTTAGSPVDNNYVGGFNNLLRIDQFYSILCNQAAGGDTHIQCVVGSTAYIGPRPRFDTSGAFKAGTVDCTFSEERVDGLTDASGDMLINHGLNATPSNVLITNLAGNGATFVAYAHSIGATSFKVRMLDAAGAAAASAGIAVYYRCLA